MNHIKTITSLLVATAVTTGDTFADLSDPHALKTHAPIVVKGDVDLQKFTVDPKSGVHGGPGTTEKDAYVIENHHIKLDKGMALDVREVKSHIIIRNVWVQGMPEGALPDMDVRVMLYKCDNLRVENCRFTRLDTVEINALKGGLVADSDFIGNNRGFEVWRCDGITFRGNKANDNELGVMVWGSTRLKFINNVANHNLREGISFNSSEQDKQDDIHIQGGEFSSNIWAGISIEGAGSNFTVERNRCIGNLNVGIVHQLPKDGKSRIVDNVFESSSKYGILVQDTRGAVIRGNTVKQSYEGGITIMNSSDCYVASNAVFGAKGCIQLVSQSHNVVVENNKISTGLLGIEASSTTNSVFRGNTIERVRGGIYVLDSKDSRIESNSMVWNQKGMTVTGERNVVTNNTVKQSGAGLSLSGSNHIVEGNTFERYSYGGMVVGSPGTNNVVRNNRFQHSISSGVLVLRSATNVLITGNVLQDNYCPPNIASGLGGIIIRDNATNIVIRQNKLIANDNGIAVHAGQVVVQDNEFRRNQEAIRVFGAAKQTATIADDNRFEENGKKIVEVE